MLHAPTTAVSDERVLAREVEHLRTLLERQPSCLMRIGVDGTLLAVNGAALGLLGATDLAQVLGTPFQDRIAGEPAVVWQDFTERLAAGPVSFECELTDPAGAPRAIVIQGVSLEHRPDGVASMLVAVRDVSTARRLESSLREQVEQLTREREQLSQALAQLQESLASAVQSTRAAQAVIQKGTGE